MYSNREYYSKRVANGKKEEYLKRIKGSQTIIRIYINCIRFYCI
jgi:hypothetical protein